MSRSASDVMVIGAGPAGLAVASALVAGGLSVRVLAPEPTAPWPASYASWADEIGGDLPLTASYRRVRVQVAEDRIHVLARGYVRIHGERLQQQFLDALPPDSVRPARVVALCHDSTGVTAELADGGTERAALAVVAAGASSQLLDGSGPASAFQVARGAWLEVDAHPFPADEALLMDLRPVDAGPPTFLYALPLGPRRVFVEETALACRPPLGLETLDRRLDLRLRRLGLRTTQVLATERCFIPLDAPLPRLDQRAVGFGAAASLVHPATGYQLARALRLAPALADAIARGLERGPAAASAGAWQVLWPPAARLTRALHLQGLEVLLDLEADGLAAFFDRFFDLPAEGWRTFLDGGAAPLPTARAMTRLFARAPWALRRRLAAPRALDRALRALAPLGGVS